jgi:hypothetical protein
VPPGAEWPRSGAAPAEVPLWWEQLDPHARKRLLQEEPARLGRLDGVPVDVRDSINREQLALTREELAHQLALMPPRRTDTPETVRERTRISDLMLGVHATIGFLGEAERAGRKARLLAFDTIGRGHAVLALGDIENADHVAVVVPGMSHQLGTINSAAWRLKWLWDAVHAVDANPRTAIVAWWDYDMPPWFRDATAMDAAEAAVPRLASFIDGLQAVRGDRPVHLTVVAHSYGTIAFTLALLRHRGLLRDGDDAVFVGSPGIPAAHASSLHDPERMWASGAERDPITYMAGLGRLTDPRSPGFRANVYDAGYGGDALYFVHETYFREAEPLRRLALIVLGRGHEVELVEHRTGVARFAERLRAAGVVALARLVLGTLDAKAFLHRQRTQARERREARRAAVDLGKPWSDRAHRYGPLIALPDVNRDEVHALNVVLAHLHSARAGVVETTAPGLADNTELFLPDPHDIVAGLVTVRVSRARARQIVDALLGFGWLGPDGRGVIAVPAPMWVELGLRGMRAVVLQHEQHHIDGHFSRFDDEEHERDRQPIITLFRDTPTAAARLPVGSRQAEQSAAQALAGPEWTHADLGEIARRLERALQVGGQGQAASFAGIDQFQRLLNGPVDDLIAALVGEVLAWMAEDGASAPGFRSVGPSAFLDLDTGELLSPERLQQLLDGPVDELIAALAGESRSSAAEDGPRGTGMFIRPPARFHRSDAASLDRDTGELVDAGYRFARVWTANETSAEGYAGVIVFGRDAGGLVYAGVRALLDQSRLLPTPLRPAVAELVEAGIEATGSRLPTRVRSELARLAATRPELLRELLWSTAGHIARVEEELSGPLADALRAAALAQHDAAAEVVPAVWFDGPDTRTALGAAAWDVGVASKDVRRAIDAGAAETEFVEWATALVRAAASADPETGWPRWDWHDDQLRAVAALAVMWGHAMRADTTRRAEADAAFAAALPEALRGIVGLARPHPVPVAPRLPWNEHAPASDTLDLGAEISRITEQIRVGGHLEAAGHIGGIAQLPAGLDGQPRPAPAEWAALRLLAQVVDLVRAAPWTRPADPAFWSWADSVLTEVASRHDEQSTSPGHGPVNTLLLIEVIRDALIAVWRNIEPDSELAMLPRVGTGIGLVDPARPGGGRELLGSDLAALGVRPATVDRLHGRLVDEARSALAAHAEAVQRWAGGANDAQLGTVVDRLRKLYELREAVSGAHGVTTWSVGAELRDVLADHAAIDALDGLAALDQVDDPTELLGVLARSRIGVRHGLRQAVVLRRSRGESAPDSTILVAALTGMPELPAVLAADVGRRLQELLLAPLGPVVAPDLVRLLRLLAEGDLIPRVVEGIVPGMSWPTERPALWRKYVALLSSAADQLEGLPRDRDAQAGQLRSLAEAVRALPARELLATLGSEDTLPPRDVHPATIVDLLRLDVTAVPEVAEALRQRLRHRAAGRADASLFRRRSRLASGASRRTQEPSQLLREHLGAFMSFDVLDHVRFWSRRDTQRGLDMLGDPDVRVVLVVSRSSEEPIAAIPAVELPQGLLVLDRDVTMLAEGRDTSAVRETVRAWAVRYAQRTRRTVRFPHGSPLVDRHADESTVHLDARIATGSDETLIGDAVALGSGPARRRRVAAEVQRDLDPAAGGGASDKK